MKTRTPGKERIQEPSGQRVALFPALSEGSKEKRAVSILLACIEQVPELARSLLQGQGPPLGKKSRLKAWTEAGPIGKKGSDRPDGRIEVESARGQMWVALLEAKIGKASLDSPQIEAYLAEARGAGAEALITISNDFAVLANHHPTYRGKIPKGMTLLHWSWSSILTKCRLLTDGGEIEDRDHGWVIKHLVRFLSHVDLDVVERAGARRTAKQHLAARIAPPFGDADRRQQTRQPIPGRDPVAAGVCSRFRQRGQRRNRRVRQIGRERLARHAGIDLEGERHVRKVEGVEIGANALPRMLGGLVVV